MGRISTTATREAFATVAYNAGDIYRKIQEICRRRDVKR